MALLQVAAFGIFLNAAAAYGDCAMPMQADNEQTEKRMPCHPVSESSDTPAVDTEVENCCAVCVAVAISASASETPQAQTDSVIARSSAVLPTSGFDPPFRPPNLTLS